MKNFFWRVGRLWCAGIVLLLLRLTQNRSGFDPATGLSVYSLPGIAALVILGLCAAAELAFSFRNCGEKSEFRAQFAPPGKERRAGFWRWLPGPGCCCSTGGPGPAASCLCCC